MFDFEKLDVYEIANEVGVKVYRLIKENPDIDEVLAKQLKGSSTMFCSIWQRGQEG